jgi:hypothetical protein
LEHGGNGKYESLRADGPLIAAGVILGRDKNQSGADFGGAQLRCAESMKNADDRGVSGEDANTDRSDDCGAKNKWHEKRNHGKTTLSSISKPAIKKKSR